MPKSNKPRQKPTTTSSAKPSYLSPTPDERVMAKYIAITVRNAMEDFHVRHLSNDQMRELNPIIRNAICSAIHAVNNLDNYPNARDFFQFQMALIPDYWEEPELAPQLQREKYIDPDDNS